MNYVGPLINQESFGNPASPEKSQHPTFLSEQARCARNPVGTGFASPWPVRKSTGLILALGLVWLGGVGLAIRSIMAVERTAGQEATVTASWPAKTTLQRPSEGAMLVMVAHPKCPCTRSSLQQLAWIVSRSRRPIKGYVLFTRPADQTPSWARTALWDQAAEIAGITPIEDVAGREAEVFGGLTSGHVLLYDARGQLRFSGGITSGRGVAGDSAGADSILAWLRTGAGPFERTPVFGCPLFGSNVAR